MHILCIYANLKELESDPNSPNSPQFPHQFPRWNLTLNSLTSFDGPVRFHTALHTLTGCSNTDSSRALHNAWLGSRPCRAAPNTRNAAPAPGSRLKNERLLSPAPTKIQRSSAGATSYKGAMSTRVIAAIGSSSLPTHKTLPLILTLRWFSYARAPQMAAATPKTPTKKRIAYMLLKESNEVVKKPVFRAP